MEDFFLKIAANNFDFLEKIFYFLKLAFFYSWWLILPLILFLIFKYFFLPYQRIKFVKKIKWKILEIKIQKDKIKPPKAMEQIFASFYAAYSYGFTWLKKWIDGAVDVWFSFEMVGTAEGVKFYIRFPEDKQELVESAIYAQYPDAELEEVEDYTDQFPENLPNKIYDVWGTEFVLAKESYYPIKTYRYFEDETEEKRVDPLAIIAEAMSKLKREEAIWIQVIFSPTGEPTGNNWKKEGEEKIEEILGRKKTEKKKNSLDPVFQFMKDFALAPIQYPEWKKEEKKETPSPMIISPDKELLIKEISNKISKLGFETIIRFVYLDRADSFSAQNVATVFGAFHQFNTQNLNSFKPKNLTLYDSFFARIFPRYKKIKLYLKKRKIFDSYKERRFGDYNRIFDEKLPVFNIEELATVYHFPTEIVRAPKLKRVEFRKGEPPVSLPIE